jgi:RHS repeat-associated protein
VSEGPRDPRSPLSATNPENGTVTYAGTTLRTYSYDTNPYDATYSQNSVVDLFENGPTTQNSAGRLTAIQYGAINYDVVFDAAPGSTTFTDMFSYWQPGNIAGKRLRVTKVAPYPNGLNHTQTAVGDLNLAYGYNYEGKLTSVTYPTDAYGTTPQFTYSYDNMMRPVGMTDQNSASIVSNVQYGLANELLQMTYIGGATETRIYNSMLQLTNITGLGQNITYTFPAAGQNAGKITSQTDNISGETVSYLYDSLNRLTSAGATSNAWSQTYSYDGFGNLTNRMGTGAAQSTTISTPANLANNQLSGYTYDPNGNQISTGYAYDAENRMVQANAGAIQYGYDAQNKRIWQASFSNCSGNWCLSSDLVSLFGIDGKLIATYSPQPGWNNTQTQIPIPFYVATERVYFGRKLVATLGGSGYLQSLAQNRLESAGQYYLFGEQRTAPPPGAYASFATYTRDSATGLDYADQRHYASTFGRFMTPDQYQASGGLNDPQGWNRYAYTRGDPVNGNDPSGQFTCIIDGFESECGADVCSGLQGGLYLIGTGSGDGNTGVTIPCGDFGIGIGLIPNPGGVGVCPSNTTDDGGGNCVPDDNPTPPCDIQLRDTGVIAGAVHSYLEVVDSSGLTHVLKGIQSSMAKSIIPGLTFLNGSDTPTGGLNIDHPTSDYIDFDSANNPALSQADICNDVKILIGQTNNFPTNKVRYDLFGKLAPNSNSFIRYLTTFIPNIGITSPAGAVGWKHKIFKR